MSEVTFSQKLPEDLDPLKQPERLLDWLRWYLTPSGMGGAGRMTHQFTINGLTYPFVRDQNFAAVPDPPQNRRYDMYANLFLARPGDLLFFFQADPTDPAGGIDNRRGIRGLYRVVNGPFRGGAPVSGGPYGYVINHACPNCGTHHGEFRSTCPSCGVPYPTTNIPRLRSTHQPQRVLGSQLTIEPVVLFERSISDERVYGDMASPAIVWTGRHDNQMGPGKGSSIRHLLPEEAIELVRLLLTEPGQLVGPPGSGSPTVGGPLQHASGVSVHHVPVKANNEVEREDVLYHVITMQLSDPSSSLRTYLSSHLPPGITWKHLEYASCGFPWGYTAGEADYVLTFRDARGRRFIVVIECKKGNDNDPAVLQSVLYAERIVQHCFLSAPSNFVPYDGVEVLPIVVARNVKVPRGSSRSTYRVAVPQSHSFHRTYFGGVSVAARVRTPEFLCYLPPPDPTGSPGTTRRDAAKFNFQPVPPKRLGQINWIPNPGSVGTQVEMDHILQTTWAQARARAGI